MTGTPLKRPTTAALVADEIRKRIISGDLGEGAQLRQETLASEFGVSRIPVREALKQLEAEGFITIVTHRGAVVSKLSLDEISEMFDLRVLLETWLLGYAIPRITDEDLNTAKEILDCMIANDRLEQWGALNWDFHLTLYRASRRSETIKLLNRVHAMIDRYVRLQISLTAGQLKAHQEHQRILDLCRQRDTVRAVRALEDHILEVKDALVRRLAK